MKDKLKPENDLFDRLFDSMIQFVASDGGDGDGILLCKYYDYKEIADSFENYIQNYYISEQSINSLAAYWKRINFYNKHFVLFTDERNENFVIQDQNCEYDPPRRARIITKV